MEFLRPCRGPDISYESFDFHLFLLEDLFIYFGSIGAFYKTAYGMNFDKSFRTVGGAYEL